MKQCECRKVVDYHASARCGATVVSANVSEDYFRPEPWFCSSVVVRPHIVCVTKLKAE